MEKKCSQCHEVKAFSEYQKDSRRKDGLRSNCKDCVSKYQKERNARKKMEQLLEAERQDMHMMFAVEAQICEPTSVTKGAIVLEETIQMTEEVAQLLAEVKQYNMEDKKVVKAIELRKAIQKKIGKIAKNVKQIFAEDEIIHQEDKAMKEVFGEDWKPSRHGYIVLDMKQAVAFAEKHVQ